MCKNSISCSTVEVLLSFSLLPFSNETARKKIYQAGRERVVAEMFRSFGYSCLGQFGCLWHQLLHASSNHSPAGWAAGPAHQGPLPAGTACPPAPTVRAQDRKTLKELKELSLFSLSEVYINIDRHFSVQR